MVKKRKNFLITGGMGFIGAAISRLLVKQGHKITIFDDRSRGNFKKIQDIKKKIKIIKGDIRNFGQLNN